MSSKTKVLLTGASGYIGGAVLHEILSLGIKDIHVSALVRSATQVKGISTLGVAAIIFRGLDDVDAIKSAAAEHDIVINCASAMDLNACLAILEGLAIRRKATGRDVHLLHTSGTSNYADHPISGTPDLSIKTDESDIYGWEKANADGWILRKVNTTLIDTGLEYGIKTYIFNPPLIYGRSSGPFNQKSLQIPALINVSLASQQAVVLGRGEGIWNVTHIDDVAKMYGIILKNISEHKSSPSGKEGYYFLDAGEATWKEISEQIARTGKKHGHFKSEVVKQVNAEELATYFIKSFPFLNASMVEVIWGSNSRTRGERSRAWGWSPSKSLEAFRASFDDEWE
ncbi:hypothetical protein LTR84_006415 [Exophiala bonariae]|uniref:NAD-dependent epimerase/dehydratase domain-containing protein n=1 Tax=Exophiala bonariae TaxID=1690606 RepID=A0AAV9N4N0_9EURO|nr:hypothetical protein LTR84_006415 [Exophiala bonariae]